MHGHALTRASFSLAGMAATAGLVLAAIAITAWLCCSADRPAADPGWGAAILNEDFSDASWRSRWLPKDDHDWAVKDGRLVSTSAGLALLICRQRLTPPIAIEYTGQMLPGGRPCDLSLTWTESENALIKPDRFGDDARTWRIQVGAYENQFCAIFMSPGEYRMAYNALQLVPGRDYRFRVEIEGEIMSVTIDGVEVMRYRDRMPTTSGYMALYGFFPDKAFDDIRIWQKERTGLVHATAMGDILASFGHNQDAAVVYARLAEGGGPEAEQALFRKGLAERRLGRNDLARETWTRLTDPDLTQAADALRLEDIFTTGQHDIFLERLQSYWHRHASGRDDLRHQWQQACKSLVLKATTDPAVVERYLAVRETLFRDDPASAYEATAALDFLQRYEDIVRFFPKERKAYAKALLALGRLDEVARLPGLIPEDRWTMQRMRGDFTALLKEGDLDPYSRAWILCKLGRIQEITSGPLLNYPAMLYQGRAEQLLGMRPLGNDAARNALLITGRYAEGAGAGIPGILHSGLDGRAMVMLGNLEEAENEGNYSVAWAKLMRASEAGERSTVAALRPLVVWPRNLSRYNDWFAGLVIGPMVDQLDGDAKALERSLQRAEREWTQAFAKRAWFLAMTGLGKASDAEVLAMPVVSEGQAWLALGKALRAEIAGDGPAALLAYRTYAALPAQDRLLDDNAPDVQVETFVQWRMRTLGR